MELAEPNLNSLRGDDDEQHFSYAMQLVSSVSLPMVLMAAGKLGVLEIIAAAGPGAQLSASEVVARLPEVGNPNAGAMLDRMMRLLASHSVLTCSAVDGGERVYGLAPVAKYFVRNEKGVSVGPLLNLIVDKVFTQSWYELENAVVEGGVPFDRVYGVHAFEYPGKDSRFNEVFNKAMINHSTLAIDRIVEVYKGFQHLKTLIDVGGGLGVTMNGIVTKWPNIKGINFDLQHVIQHAPAYPGVEHVAGDMFESVPEGADAIFMKWILHDWDDDHCLKLLKNCYKVLPEKGKVIVVDRIAPTVPDTNSPSHKVACQSDMIMMTQNPGGKERTEQEFLFLASNAGFRGIRLECVVCNLSVMEFYK